MSAQTFVNAINNSVPTYAQSATGRNIGMGGASVPYPNKYIVEFAQIALQGLIQSDASCLFTNPELAAKAFDIGAAMYGEATKRGLA